MHSSLLRAKVLIGFPGFRELQLCWLQCSVLVSKPKYVHPEFSLQTYANGTMHLFPWSPSTVQSFSGELSDKILYFAQNLTFIIFFQTQIEEKLTLLFYTNEGIEFIDVPGPPVVDNKGENGEWRYWINPSLSPSFLVSPSLSSSYSQVPMRPLVCFLPL